MHYKAQSSEIFLRFQAKKIKRAVIFYLLANHAKTADLSFPGRELSNNVRLVQVRPRKVFGSHHFGVGPGEADETAFVQ